MRTPTVQRRDLPTMALVLAIGLLFPLVLLGQSASPTATSASAQTSEAKPSESHSLTEDQAAGTLATAAQIQTQGERSPDPADVPPDSSTALAAPSKIEPPALAAVQPTNEPAKYDVTLIGHRNVGTGLNFYSLEREIVVGQDLAKQVEQSSRLVTDPEVTEYVNRIGQNLVRNSDSRVPFTIKVIDSGEINAFALPGGFFYVDSGLILAADSEAELAAIMAHEIAHVAARHATKNMTKQQIWNMASIPLMFIGGPAGYAIAEIASIAVPLGFLKFSRDAEREADMLGLQYDYAAGYDPQAFVQFFEKLKVEEKKKHSNLAKMFSSHPMNSERITAAQEEIRTYLPDRDSYVVDTSEFEAMKVRLLALDGGMRMNVQKGGGIRPVLRKPSQVAGESESDPSVAPKPATTDNNDGGPPVLKK